MHNVPLSQIMVTKVYTVGPEDSLASVEERMRLYHIRHMPIVDEHGRLAGIITHRDLLRLVRPRRTENGYYFDREQMDGYILRYVMTRDPITLGPADSVKQAVDIMAREKFGCIPIVAEEKKLVGIVTQVDILKFLARWLEEEAA